MKAMLQPIDEAYKMVSGEPSMTAVSDAAQGKKPTTDDEQRMDDYEDKNENEDSQEDTTEDSNEHEMDDKCVDINEAYAMLFESLSMILRGKSDD